MIAENSPGQRGTGADQIPLGRHSILPASTVLVPILHVKRTVLPTEKSLPMRVKSAEASGSGQTIPVEMKWETSGYQTVGTILVLTFCPGEDGKRNEYNDKRSPRKGKMEWEVHLLKKQNYSQTPQWVQALMMQERKSGGQRSQPKLAFSSNKGIWQDFFWCTRLFILHYVNRGLLLWCCGCITANFPWPMQVIRPTLGHQCPLSTFQCARCFAVNIGSVKTKC